MTINTDERDARIVVAARCERHRRQRNTVVLVLGAVAFWDVAYAVLGLEPPRLGVALRGAFIFCALLGAFIAERRR